MKNTAPAARHLVWLAVLSLLARRDRCCPILHYVMPLTIGIALLVN